VVNHSVGEITNDRKFTTNRMELQWSLIKRWARMRYDAAAAGLIKLHWSLIKFRTHIKVIEQEVPFAAFVTAFQ
ncbi:unnamed protein product, partial [Prorocentrum cordatum]